MQNEALAKLIFELSQDPKARQQLVENGKLSAPKLSNVELDALKKVFSLHSLISAGLVTSVVPTGLWA
ncbi:MAG: hypothetical protein M0021_04305 [Clostridia bacterium]|nr:hypothetical protein [Clostridia bacterium]